MAAQAPPKTVDTQFNPIVDDQANSTVLYLTKAQVRAALLVKIVQILKLKKNAQKSTVDFMLSVLNQPEEANPLTIRDVSHLMSSFVDIFSNLFYVIRMVSNFLIALLN